MRLTDAVNGNGYVQTAVRVSILVLVPVIGWFAAQIVHNGQEIVRLQTEINALPTVEMMEKSDHASSQRIQALETELHTRVVSNDEWKARVLKKLDDIDLSIGNLRLGLINKQDRRP